MELKRVVVTGIGAISPLGNTAEETWKKVVAGVSGAAPITHFDTTGFKTTFGCEVKNFNAEDYIDRKEARKMDPYCQYAMAAAQMAVENSQLNLETIDKNRVGVVLGVGIGGMHTFEEEEWNYERTHEAVGPKYNPFFIPKMIADISAGQISMKYGFHGPNYITSSACASSTNALADAFNLIRLGKAEVIVTGGAEAAIYPGGVGGFNAMHALSTRNDEPEKASRPFSKSRDGFVDGLNIEFTARFRPDISFVGVVGLDVKKNSLSTNDTASGLHKAKILEISKSSYVMAESRKFGVEGNFTFATLENVRGVITETEPAAGILKAARELNLEIILPD